MRIDLEGARRRLRSFDFTGLLVEELGWNRFATALPNIQIDELHFRLTPIAEKCGMVVYVCELDHPGEVPSYPARRKLESQLAKLAYEHILIFLDGSRSIQIWQWVKREAGKQPACREHTFRVGQSGEALLQKLQDIAFDLDEEERLTITDVTRKVKRALDVEKVTKAFYERFRSEHQKFLRFIEGIQAQAHREWYASLMLNRMMFIYFIQKKGFLDKDTNYLRSRLQKLRSHGTTGRFHTFYRLFLLKLFHEGLGKPEALRTSELAALLGDVPYLNGGLFDVHQLEREHDDIHIPDEAFERLFDFFEEYDWHLDEHPRRNDREINPDVLGYIFEKYVNQKQMGAYYTKEDITGYIARHTILQFLFDQARKNCPIAFRPNSAIWSLLRDDPDRYIYPSLRHGITFDLRGSNGRGRQLLNPPQLPRGLSDSGADVGVDSNAVAPSEFGLPDETWREHAARRKRYLSVRGKLSAGEIKSIRDFTTNNLDLERFAADVLAQAEGPELIKAFWEALENLTILDPTCGSGAFLFSALNVLEPIYTACLEGMQGFIDDLDRRPGADNSKRLRLFRETLERLEQHPNRRYFILKSIVVNNLYGVDIMEEAVEICKLRLFLKLVAQLETPAQIEPLPDIDFNIRTGNTLVGFASLQELKDVYSADLEKALHLADVTERAENASRAFDRFREQQLMRGVPSNEASAFKRQLRSILDELHFELDRSLARTCGVKDSDKKAFDHWRDTHQPFHWFVEFHKIMASGGFQIIIGNPPYVEIPKQLNRSFLRSTFNTALDEWSRDEDLYTLVVERSLALLSPTGNFGLILPLSIAFSTKEPFQRLRARASKENGMWWWSHYDRIPSSLFGNEVRTRCTIALLSRSDTSDQQQSSCTTALQRWEAINREHLFPLLSYATIPIAIDNGIPKISSELQSAALKQLLLKSRALARDLTAPISYSALASVAPRFPSKAVFVGGTAYNWFPAWREIPETTTPSGQSSLPARTIGFKFDTDQQADAVFAILCSSIGYWWWAVSSDGFNLKKWLVERLPISVSHLSEAQLGRLAAAGASLRRSLRKHYVYKDNKGRVGNFYLPACSREVAEIDTVLSTIYPELTEEFFDDIRTFNASFARTKEAE